MSRVLLNQVGQFANKQIRTQTHVSPTPEHSLIPLSKMLPWGFKTLEDNPEQVTFQSTFTNTQEARGRKL